MAGEWGAPRKQVRDAVDPSGFGGHEERMRILEERIAKLEHGAFSENVAFGPEGIRVKGGTGLTVEAGGGVSVKDGGDVTIADGGTLTVIDASGNVLAIIGDVGGGTRGIRVIRTDGTVSFQVGDKPDGPDPDGTGTLAIFDQQQNAILWDDPRSGFGFGLPSFPFHLFPWRATDRLSTNSTTWQPLYLGYPRRWSKRTGIMVLLSCDTGVTGEARVVLDGVQVGSTVTASGTSVNSAYITFDLPDGTFSDVAGTLEVQGRVASGTGKVYVAWTAAESRPAEPPA